MRLRSYAALVAVVAATACVRITVTSNATPAPTVVEKRQQHSFVAGLVPPTEVNVREECPNGVATVETVHSPANMLATLVTFGIWSPLSVKVTCATR
jgi:hypothetical protein